jgi:VanZ family protein
VNRSVLRLWGPFVAALAGVFWVSSLSVVPGARFFWDKLLHAVGYMGLGVLALRAFHGGIQPLRRTPTIYAGLTIIAWAISDEIHQYFVPGRDSSALDVVADTVGFGISVLLVAAWQMGSVRSDRPR